MTQPVPQNNTKQCKPHISHALTQLGWTPKISTENKPTIIYFRNNLPDERAGGPSIEQVCGQRRRAHWYQAFGDNRQMEFLTCCIPCFLYEGEIVLLVLRENNRV